MNFKKTYVPAAGYTPLCFRDNTSFRDLQFGIIRLSPGQRIDYETAESETAFIVMEGTADFAFDDTVWKSVGHRRTVFEGPAAAAYLPRRKRVSISSDINAMVAVCAAATAEDTAPNRIHPGDVRKLVLGVRPWERETHFIVDDSSNSKRLFVGEAFVTPGNWAGFPPHKHDTDNMPAEDMQEELYFFRFQPEQGFGLQCMYTADGEINECYKVGNNDLVEFPRGYHTFVGAPGYNTYFLWASSVRHPGMYRSPDPDHAWISALENLMRKR